MIANKSSYRLALAVGCTLGVLIGFAVFVSISRQTSLVPVGKELQQAEAGDDIPSGYLERDIGNRLHEFGRPAVWRSSHMELADTGYSAAVGPNRYTDENDQAWDFYSIDVERPDGSMRHVYFQRDFEITDLPREVIDKKVDELVTFNEDSRVGTFSIGSKVVTYRLPDL